MNPNRGMFNNLYKNLINPVLKKDTGIELFSGEFWSGRKAKELGLVDDIGNPEEILKNLDALDGIGETQVKSVEDFFSNKKNAEIIQNLINALKIKDPTPIHRLTFKPLKNKY